MTCTPADVRILIPDLGTGNDQLFTDDQIARLLALYNGNAKRAAAAAIDAVANDQALLYKSVRTDDLSVDGTKVADSLRKRADSLRGEAQQDDIDGAIDAFVIVPTGTSDEICRPEASAHPWPWL